MELTQLIYFQAVADYQTVTKAASALNITQSAISKAIGALEAELGATLFLRSNRRMTLTGEGAAFLRHVRAALLELENGRQELREQREDRELRLRVQTPEFLLGIIEAYLRARPGTRITQSFQGPDLESALLEGQLTFCISSHPFSNEAITWQPLLTEPIYLLVSRNHPLAEERAVPLSLFSGDSFITFNSNPDLQAATEEFCRLAGFTPNIAYETGETPDLLKLVDMGLGVAFCSSCIRLRRYQDDAEYQESTSPYRYLRITYPQCSRTIGISYIRGRRLSGESQAFLSFVEAYFSSLDRQIRAHFPDKS